MGEVLQLPTAPAQHVKQPQGRNQRARAIAAAQAAGVYALAPTTFRAPWLRRQDAEDAERQQLFAEGGIVRSGPTMLAAAALLALTPKQQRNALARLHLLASDHDAPACRAALVYAQRILGKTP